MSIDFNSAPTQDEIQNPKLPAKQADKLPALAPVDDPYLRTAARVASESAFLKYVKGSYTLARS